MEAYKSWVRRNRQLVSSFDTLANTMTWFLPERLASSELTPETMSTLLGLVTVMNQHIISTAPGQLTVPELEPNRSFPWPLCVSVMKELEVLTEMAAEFYLGSDKKWGPVASLEAVKAILRLIILRKSGYKMLIDGGESENVASTANTAADPNTRPETSREPLPWRNRESSNPNFYSRDLEGRAMQAMQRLGKNTFGNSRPSWVRQQEESRLGIQPSQNPKQKISTNKVFVCGEVLLISRPLLYLLLVWRYGLKSWKPWATALSIDVTGMCLVSNFASSELNRPPSSQDGAGNSVSSSLSDAEDLELRRRRIRWALYLMRSPCFDKYTRRGVESVEQILSPIPLVGLLAEKGVELLLAVQGLYSYTSAS